MIVYKPRIVNEKWRIHTMKESPFAYNLMVTSYRIEDLFHKPGRQIKDFGIRKGDTVVDYGCGPGRHLKTASDLVGSTGRVYAADINLIALEHAQKRIQKEGLLNIVPYLIENDACGIPGNCADVVYALDMFHRVGNTNAFFSELFRLIKNTGVLYLEDGHQARRKTLEKVQASGQWKLGGEKAGHVILKPLQ
jgi:ubiquinone/menaquinone biosynthesis C-methylase UbiE